MRVLTALLVAVSVGARPVSAQEWRTDFTRHAVPLDEIVSGGPPRDGIPALDHPRFEFVNQAAGWLDAREPVVVVETGNETRIYPVRILVWHEIVNDVVGDRPVAVTYCPLCNAALVFDRRLDGRVLDFGTTGRLRHSDLVMYDRQTESWWQQLSGEAIVGELTGRRLRTVDGPMMSWAEARALHPRARVLSRQTGFDRPYGRNPYERYDSRRGPIASFFSGRADTRLDAMERVVTLDSDSGSAAFAFSALRVRPVVNDRVGARPVVVWWASGAGSALDAGEIAAGRDVGAVVVFDRRLDGRVLTFVADGADLRDRETSTRWDRSGRAKAGPLAGRRLVAVPHGTPFWFAWAAFRPNTRIVR